MERVVEVAARVYRGEPVEAIHYASVAVVDALGKLTHYLGDPEMVVVSRSTIKPFQLMPLIATGAADEYCFSEQQLAVMCGSHNGSDEHRDVVLSNLEAAGNIPADLKCGNQWPIGMQDSHAYPKSGEDMDPVRHNCSGKHSGFLALTKFLKEDTSKYIDPECKSQQMVKQSISRYCGYPAEKMAVNTDSCSAPNFTLPLNHIAIGYMKLASGEGDTSTARRVAERVRNAMLEYPEMVSGKNRFDLALSWSFSNNVICKVGGEAIEGIGFSNPQIGIAIKVHDGSFRALGAICIEVLRQLGIIDNPNDFKYLKKHIKPEVWNSRDLVTGHIVADFELKKV